MIYTDLTRKAIRIACFAHQGQVDKAGIPYVLHPIHLAEQMETEDTCVVALLHDIIEDTDVSVEDLEAVGFPQNQIDAIIVMTHDKGEDYMDYVRRVKKNPIAAVVKKEDILHNLDLTRIPDIRESDYQRVEKKYKPALKILEENV